MFIQATQLVGAIIIAEQDQRTLGQIRHLLIEAQNGELIALVVRPTGWFKKDQFLSIADILQVIPGMILVRDDEALTEIESLPRAEAILRERIKILGQPARTESGERLGRVYDFVLETETWQVAKFYLRNLLNERIIPVDYLHSITRKEIIFLDRINQPESVGVQPEAAAS